MRSAQHRHADRVHVLIEGGLDDLLCGLVQPGVDDLEPRLAQCQGDDLGSAVVTIQTGLGDEDPDGSRPFYSDASLTLTTTAAAESPAAQPVNKP